MLGFIYFLAAVPAIFASPRPNELARRHEELSRRYNDSLISEKWLIKAAPGHDFDSILRDVASVLSVDSDTYEPLHAYHIGGFHGFSFEGSEEMANTIRALESIEMHHPDRRLQLSSNADDASTIVHTTIEWPAPYGLARISNQEPGSSEYSFDSSAGTGTTIYFIDTGINADHEEFGGRAVRGRNFVLTEPNDDLTGHGTHCAGIAAGEVYGVAKNATVVGVKIYDADERCTTSDLVAALDWVLADAKAKGNIEGSVVSLSLAYHKDDFATEPDIPAQAVKALIDEGLFVAVAAGNDGMSVEHFSPANLPEACTVGAIDHNDARVAYSNYGDGIDVFAPGHDVTSAWIGSPNATRVESGTSMAAPHVAGLGAYLLGLGLGTPNGADLCDRIVELSIKDRVTDVRDSPNRIAHNNM